MTRPTSQKTPIYAFDFTSDYKQAGWIHTPANPEDKPKHSESEGWSIDRGGQIDSPRIPVASHPFQYYRMSFRSRAEVQGYYAVFFQDAQGQALVDDDYASIYPSQDWTDNEVAFRGREGAATFSVSFIATTLPEIRDLSIIAVSAEDAAACADRLYATMPPVNAALPADRMRRLPRTWASLASGKPLRVVMLGDSIINDTGNGLWDALVMRQYPLAELSTITSVRGATGCWHYRTDENFKTYVEDRTPDLLIVGGISNPSRDGSSGLAAIREVVTKARQRIGCEILLLSGPMGHDWRERGSTPGQTLKRQPKPKYADFRKGLGEKFAVFMETEEWDIQALETLAKELDLPFFDMHNAWHCYLGDSQKPWEWYHRDVVHANDRGKQILSRMLAQYFSPQA